MTHTKTIYENYRTWCKEHGVDHPIMEGQLIRTVRSALKLPRTWETKVVKEFGRPVRCWPGFKLQED
jgi:hypothetical protein